MRIVRRNSDSVVVYTFPDSAKLFITSRGLIEKDGMYDFGIKAGAYELLKVKAPDTPVTGRASTYINGVWAVLDEGLLEADVYVTRAQFFMSIHEERKTAELKAAVSGLNTRKKIRYDEQATFKRTERLIVDLVDAMPTTSVGDMDLIFKRASQINAR